MDYYLKIRRLVALNKLQPYIVEDVFKRCNDWFASGGKPDDDYIKNQYKYMLKVVEYKDNNKK